MKKQVRRGVFETNSSSTHSLTMCLKSDYDKWLKGESVLYTGYGFGYSLKKPIKNTFYTMEEAIDFIQFDRYASDLDLNDIDAVKEYMKDDGDWMTIEDYERYCEYFEEFEETITTPNGDQVVAFGYYGHDC